MARLLKPNPAVSLLLLRLPSTYADAQFWGSGCGRAMKLQPHVDETCLFCIRLTFPRTELYSAVPLRYKGRLMGILLWLRVLTKNAIPSHWGTNDSSFACYVFFPPFFFFGYNKRTRGVFCCWLFLWSEQRRITYLIMSTGSTVPRAPSGAARVEHGFSHRKNTSRLQLEARLLLPGLQSSVEITFVTTSKRQWVWGAVQ